MTQALFNQIENRNRELQSQLYTRDVTREQHESRVHKNHG